jgi:uncharacterized protein YjbJ (UPF0337 family)
MGLSHRGSRNRDSTKEDDMNVDVIKGQWKQIRGKVKAKWGDLTDDDLARIEGNYDKLVGLLQERYGYARDRAAQEVDAFVNGLDKEMEKR